MARETTLTGAWLALADALGGVGKLAEACGVSRSTIERWAAGTQMPHALIRDMVNKVAVANACKPPFKPSGVSVIYSQPVLTKRGRAKVARG